MCGLVFVHQKSKAMTDKELGSMCSPAMDVLSNRGPDSSKYKIVNGSYLGHTRLRIIDTTKKADQPFQIEDYYIVFNGELVNYKECRADLEKKGYSFITSSDTEVLLNLYIEYSESMLDKCEGMYAFVIFNKKTNEIFSARDRYGIKPIFYIQVGNIIAISSTIRALTSLQLLETQFDSNKINEYFIFSFVTGEKTLIKGVKRLQPGNYLNFKDNRLSVVEYYDVLGSLINETLYKNSLFREKIEEVFLQWSLSDVSKTLLLGGGVDSALVAGIYSSNLIPIETFTFVSGDKYHVESIEDAVSAKNTATFYGLKNYQVSGKFDIDSYENLVNYCDEPIANLNAYTTDVLTKNIRLSGSKVTFCGEGADEIIGGYDRYFYCCDEYTKTGNDKYLRYGMNFLSLEHLRELNGTRDLDIRDRADVVEAIKTSDDVLNGLLLYDQKFFMPSRLENMDVVGGYNGVEVRPPFVDRRIINIANSLPSSNKTEISRRKHILFDSFGEYLPGHIRADRKIKLPSPVSGAFPGLELHDYLIETIKSSGVDSYFSEKKIMHYISEANNSDNRYSVTLTRLFTLSSWLKSFS